MRIDSLKKLCFIVLLLLLGLSALVLLMAWPFMWLWNYAVVAAITTAKPITYWVAVYLILFLAPFIIRSNQSKSD